mmetsp:Transcript_21329/g.36662  ORF Transcript_21329/g.36662 Transcript_21329/m.36662 type:complete len:243 (+) Transcript_21329:277-1005(+)
MVSEPKLADQLVRLLRPARSKLIRNRIPVLNHLQKWRKDLPRRTQLVIANKGCLVAAQHFKNQASICVRQRRKIVWESVLVRQIQLGSDDLVGQPRLLHISFHVHCFFGLHTKHKLITRDVRIRRGIQVLSSRWRMKLDADLGLALIQTFASLDDKRHTFPSWITNPQNNCGKRRALRSLGYRIIILISRIFTIRRLGKLSQNTLFHMDRVNTLKHLDFLISHKLVKVFTGQSDRRLHGHDG